MMPPAAIEPASTTAENRTIADRSALGKDDFLRLLVTQLQQQDPLNPLESTEFSSQLAQFSSLEQLQGVHDGIQQLLRAQVGESNANAVAYIGKTVQIADNTVAIRNGIPGVLGVALSGPAVDVRMLIHNENGDLVRTVAVGALPAGAHVVPWDGTDNWSQPLVDGNYTLDVVAMDGAGAPTPATALITETVTGVTFKNGSAKFIAGGQEVALSDIRAVGGT